MAPIKFEEHIREKLQEREIAPSPGAWDKLDASLGTPTENKGTPWYWYAVAASLVGILIATTVFWEESTPTAVEVVSAPETTNGQLEKEISPFQEVQATSPLATEAQNSIDKEEETNAKLANIVAHEVPVPEIATIENPKKKEPVVKISEETTLIADNGFEETRVHEKIAEVVQQIQQLGQRDMAVTGEEVDALLSAAQRDLQTQRILQSPSQKIDAAALLEDVELDLERSFRDRVFDALGESFQKIRTAVAERNN